MNILSLFDGMSCCQIALNRSGIKYDKYFASEIEPSSIKVTQHNYKDTIQLGDIKNISADYFTQQGIKIDFLSAGSPCQDFSRSNTSGEGLNGVRSGLFFEFLRLLKELKPRYFILENVIMTKKWENQITELLGVKPVEINSDIFSAQSRRRLYWTNIPINPLPTNKGLVFGDVIYDNNYKVFKGNDVIKSSKRLTKNKSYIQWDSNGKKNKSQWDRAYLLEQKICTLTKIGSNNINICLDYDNDIYRKLHPIEAERLQTVPYNYTKVDGVSDSKRFQMLGNAWTIDTISHIFSSIK